MKLDRKKLVASLLAGSRDAAGREAAAIRSAENLTPDFLYEHVRRFVLSKYLLPPDTEEDDIRELARLSLARTMKLDKSLIRELDQQTPCNHATSEATKKVLLLYALQKELGIHPEPAAYSAAATLHQLCEVIYPLLKKEESENRNN